ncbi:hypothetical protein AKJ58_00085 [candidate division MSBL1 archaeon SCGC-AAA385D11]|uniref:Transcription regulator AsnC/Lrp ligand binding domain-containing protein n=1 Tax=candidate division MSBL1 archaeon SCGC-AAA385D11 TaxID=1698286 RepID=A0A133VPL8_9EURY|nr:hypothetical protein AKJ58_00085 [candidate division MSBL1 archaeon SCGC-AAA385D11]
MVNAYSLVSTEPGETSKVYEKIGKLKGVKSVEAVAGPYDLIARIEVDSLEELTRTLFANIRGISGVMNTTTLIVIEIK